MTTHLSLSEALTRLLILNWPWLALYGVLLGVMAWATIDHWTRQVRTWSGDGWAMTLPRLTVRERLDLPD